MVMQLLVMKHFKRNIESNIISRFGASRKGAHSKKLKKKKFKATFIGS